MGEFYKEEDIATSYDEKRFSGKGGRIINRREKKNVLEMLGDIEGKKVIDLGAGTCRYSVEFASQGAEVTSLDISDKMLEVGREKAEERGVEDRITFVQGDAKNTDYDDEEFDIATSLRVFHVIDDYKALFNEMKRLTNDRVLFDFFNLWSKRIFYNKFLSMNSTLRRKRKMKKLLVKNGFYNIDIRRDFLYPYGLYRFTPSPFPWLYNKIDKTVGRTFPFKKFNSVIYIGGRKS